MLTPDDEQERGDHPLDWRPGEWMQSPFADDIPETPDVGGASPAASIVLPRPARIAAVLQTAACLLAVGGLAGSWFATRDGAAAPTLLTLIAVLVALASLSLAVGVQRAPSYGNVRENLRFPPSGFGLLALDGVLRAGVVGGSATLTRLDAGYWIALAALALASLSSLLIWWLAKAPMSEAELKQSGLIRGEGDFRRPLGKKRLDFNLRARRT